MITLLLPTIYLSAGGLGIQSQKEELRSSQPGDNPQFDISVSSSQKTITYQQQNAASPARITEDDSARSNFGFDMAQFNASVDAETGSSSKFRFQYNETYSRTISQLSNKSTFDVNPITEQYDELDVDIDAYVEASNIDVEANGGNGISFNSDSIIGQGFILEDLQLAGTVASISDFSINIAAFPRSGMTVIGQIWNATVSGGIAKPDAMLTSDTISSTSGSETYYAFNFSTSATLSSSNTHTNSTGGYGFLVMYRTDGGNFVALDSASDTSDDGGSYLVTGSTPPTTPAGWGSDTQNDATSAMTVSYEYDPNAIETYIDPNNDGSRIAVGTNGVFNETTQYSISTTYNLTYNGVVPSLVTPYFRVSYTAKEFHINQTNSVTFISDPSQQNIQWNLYFNNNYAADVNSTKYFFLPQNFTSIEFYYEDVLQTISTNYVISTLNNSHNILIVDNAIGVGNFTVLANSTNLFRLGTIATFADPGSGFVANDTAMMGILTGTTTAGDRVRATLSTAGLGISSGIVNASLRTPDGTIIGDKSVGGYTDMYSYTVEYNWNGSLVFETVLDPDVDTGVWSFQFRWSNETAAAGLFIEFNVFPHTDQEVISHPSSFNILEGNTVLLEIATFDYSHDGNWTDASYLDWDFASGQPLLYDRTNGSGFVIYTTTIDIDKDVNLVTPQVYLLNFTLSENTYVVNLQLSMTIYYRADSDLVLPVQEYGESLLFDFLPLDLSNGNITFDTTDSVIFDLDYTNSVDSFNVGSYSTNYDGTAFAYNFTVGWDSRFIRQSDNMFNLTWTYSNYRENADLASVSIAFNLTILDSDGPQISGPSDLTLNEEQTVNHLFTWTLNDEFPATYTLEQNGGSVNSSTWSDGEDVTYNLTTGLSIGSYIFNLTAFDNDANFNSWIFTLTVIDEVDPQLVVSPGDQTISISEDVLAISWNYTDNHPDKYGLYINDSLMLSGDWNNSDFITFNIGAVIDGSYKYELQVNDTSNNIVSDTIYLRIDRTNPQVVLIDDFTYELGSTGNWLNWSLTDLNPANYTIYFNESPLDNGTLLENIDYLSGDHIAINIDGLDQADYNYTLWITDTFGNTLVDEVIVTVSDTTKPMIISSTGNETIQQESTEGHEVSFTAFDLRHPSDVDPANFILFYNNTATPTESQVASGAWQNNVNEPYFIPAILPIGIHLYRFEITDTSGNTFVLLLQITVVDSIDPVINSPDDIVGIEVNDGFTTITWVANDTNPDIYIIYLNEEFQESNTWTDGGSISFQFSHLLVGTYNLTLFVNDTLGNFVTDEVMVTIQDTVDPVLAYLSEMGYNAVNTSITLSWLATDYLGDSYSFTVNGSAAGSGAWVNGSILSIDIDGLSLGVFEVNLTIVDTSGNSVTDIVMITITDTGVPVIDNLSAEVYEGDQDDVTGSWTFLASEQGINAGTVTLTLTAVVVPNIATNQVLANFVFEYTTDANGDLSFTINYNRIPAGQFLWTVTFAREDLDPQSLTHDLLVRAHTVSIQVEYQDILTQNEEYQLVVYLNYTTFNNLGIDIISQRRNGGVEGVNVSFSITVESEGQTTDLENTELTDPSGVAIYTLTPRTTLGIEKIIAITITIDDPSINFLTFSETDPSKLPTIDFAVVGGQALLDYISGIIADYWPYILAIFLVLIFTIAMISRSFRSRAKRRRAQFIELENAQEEIEGLLSIQAIILKNSDTGIPFYYHTFDEEDDSIDLSLISSLTTAISTFLSELQEGAQGFETMERQGISLTSHRLGVSDMIVISGATLPIMLFDQITRSHQAIEDKFSSNITNPVMIQEIDEDVINTLLNDNGFKVDLKGYNQINTGKNKRLKDNSSISRTIRSNLGLLDDFAKITNEAMLPITLQSLMDYLLAEGLNNEIASRLILVDYQYEVIENKEE